VVVRAIGNDLHMDYSAVGETTHLAARMEQLATPGSIRLTATTLRLVEGLVQVNALGPVPVKGLAGPVDIFELLGAGGTQRRVQAAAASGLTRFVGRQTEMASLTDALARAGEGHGQVVALVGEAGVGKSRLVYEFTRSHHTRGWLVLESASVSYGKATPYFPVIDLLKRYAHVEEHDDPRTIRAKVTGQVLILDETLQDTIPALLSLLEALPDDSPYLQLDPSQWRQRTLMALKRVLLRESQVQPLLLVCEDLHWIDSETQALLDSLIESLPTARLLLLANYRPEYQHGWGAKTYYTQVRLDPLPLRSSEELLDVLLGSEPGLVPLKQLLIGRTEGNPFFLEESVRALVEMGVLAGERGAYRRENPLQSLQVPATVQAVLAARMDRLPPEEKRLLQTAAVIGHDVPFPLLQTIAELLEEALHRGLAHLQAAEFLYETCLFPEPEYTFKHALTHEVAYGSLLLERRRALHARIVGALEVIAPERVAEQVERLAHHALRGEVWGAAVAYCRQAGAKVAARSAYREAEAYLEQALLALQHLPETRETREQAIDLRVELRPSLQTLGELGQAFERLREAETLAKALGDERRLWLVSDYMAGYFWLTGDYDRGIEVGQRALAIAADLGDALLQSGANFRLGTIYHAQGDYGWAIDFLRKSVEAFERTLIREHDGLPGFPSVPSHRAVLSRAMLTWCLAVQGEFAEGMARAEEGIRMAETANQPWELITACFGVGNVYLNKGDLHKAIPVLEHGLGLCQVWNIPIWFPATAADLGYAYTLSGRVAEALPLLEQAVERAVSMKLLYSHALWVAWLGEAYWRVGRLEDALEFAGRALDLSRDRQERGSLVWALCLLGEIAAQRDPPEVEQAEDHYRQALALAEELGMRPLQAHCRLGLGTLYTKVGRWEEAHAELSIAVEMYRAMDMTFWLPQAEAAVAKMEGR
jgi:tetratricopeptide (TPR) repeat protein